MPHHRTFDGRIFDFQGVGAAGKNDGAGEPQADEIDWDAFWDDMIDWPDDWEKDAASVHADDKGLMMEPASPTGGDLQFEIQDLMQVF